MTYTISPDADGVAIATLDSAPVNSLNLALRQRLALALDEVAADPSVRAIVLSGANGVFSAGADIREFGTAASGAEPSLRTLIAMIESSTKPVIASIAGLAMGGGLELALACHARVAAADAKIALPEVKLGLLPGAGGTQRLPRLVGAETALNMIVSGETRLAADLADTPLFDRVVQGDPLQAALALAAEVACGGREFKLARQRKVDLPNADAFFAHARRTLAAKSRHLPAPIKCVDAVAAAVGKPFDDTLERQLFGELMATPASRALRHRFQAERACARVADVTEDTPVRPVAKVGVIGAGTMGVGIAMTMLDAGLSVVLIETRQELLDKGISAMRANYERSLKKGKLTGEQLEERMARAHTSVAYEALAAADLVIEAVYEDIGVKESVFRRLDAVMKPGAILASNTSTLDLDRIAEFTARPQDVVGLHFFSPANVMKLLEVVRGAKTSTEVLATVMKLARRIGKTAVVSGVCDGFIGNRMFGHYTRVAGLLVEEGASPQQVDRVLESWGMAMGPMRMGDLAGLDIVLAVRKRQYAEHPAWVFPKSLDQLVALGRLGQKTGKGWYRYEPGQRDALPDPEVDRLLADYRRDLGITPRQIPDSEILERCIYALVNEASRLLDEGIAQRASDIDVVALTGYAFPAHRGGPLMFAEETGLYAVLRSMGRFLAETRDPFWEPAPLLKRLVETQASFKTIGALA